MRDLLGHTPGNIVAQVSVVNADGSYELTKDGTTISRVGSTGGRTYRVGESVTVARPWNSRQGHTIIGSSGIAVGS